MLTLKQKLAKNYINARGWNTKRKLLLIESDDWGSVRMPSKKAYDYFLEHGIAVDRSYFDRYDSLESAEDLECLFEVLNGFQDINGNPAVLTAFSVVANPDFEKIDNDNRQKYYYELITDTYKRNPHTEMTFQLILDGINQKLFYPQFHGREHINVKRWLEAINSVSVKEDIAFKKQAVISSKMSNDKFNYPLNYFAAFDYSIIEEQVVHKQIVSEGLIEFKRLFGFESFSFVIPCGIWGNKINDTSAAGGVKLLPGQQSHPWPGDSLRIINRIWGSKNPFGQIHWRRNCTFEPSRDHSYDWVERCMKEIGIAYRWGKPAVINSHRVNFIGSIFPENREYTLQKLKLLLNEVQKKWPEVEFVNTEDLGKIIGEDLGSKL